MIWYIWSYYFSMWFLEALLQTETIWIIGNGSFIKFVVSKFFFSLNTTVFVLFMYFFVLFMYFCVTFNVVLWREDYKQTNSREENGYRQTCWTIFFSYLSTLISRRKMIIIRQTYSSYSTTFTHMICKNDVLCRI